MVAVDTNVLVRLLVEDDPKQAAAARRLFERQPVWIAKTVLLEAAWVLRSAYHFDDQTVREALTKVVALHNVHAEDESAIANALGLTSQGLDFADALHLAGRPPGALFVSFDRSFIKRAKRARVAAISSPRE